MAPPPSWRRFRLASPMRLVNDGWISFSSSPAGAKSTPTQAACLVARFFLMSKGEEIDGVRVGVVTIEHHVPRASEWNEQFAELGQVVQGSSNIRGRFEQRKFLCYGLPGPGRCLLVFLRQKLPAALQPQRGTRRDDYSWHVGNSASFSVPQVLSQSRASCPVRCSPVS